MSTLCSRFREAGRTANTFRAARRSSVTGVTMVVALAGLVAAAACSSQPFTLPRTAPAAPPMFAPLPKPVEEPVDDQPDIAKLGDPQANPKASPGSAGDAGAKPQAASPQAGIVFLEQVFFERGHAALTALSDEPLKSIADVLKSNVDLRVEIEGHADVGEKNADKLSQTRADAVRDDLVRRGVAQERLVAKGYGAKKPLAKSDAPDRRAQNRSVVFRSIPSVAKK